METIEIRDYTGVTTEQVVVEMLTENTGTHFLDSGGAYGRHWQRNQGKDFAKLPEVKADFYVGAPAEPGGPGKLELSASLSLYHWMTSTLEFDPEMQRRLDEYAEENPNVCWFEIAEGFADVLHTLGELDEAPEVFNTYNFPDYCDLDQTVWYTKLVYESYRDQGLILSVHGGCDVRGGYGAPKCFKLRRDPDNFLNSMRIDTVCAGSDSWWLPDWCTVEPSSNNLGCLEHDIFKVPAYRLDSADDVPEFAEMVTAIRRAPGQKLDLGHTCLSQEQMAAAHEAINANVEEMQSILADAYVQHLSQQHPWFVIADHGDAWLFSEEDRTFSAGRQLKAYANES